MATNTLDKYYTPGWLCKHTVAKAIEIIGKEKITDIIEPSAGDGAFIEELDKLANELGINVEYYDLYPSHPRIVKMDYKKLIKTYKKGRLIIGNPPFGTSSSLWKAFCKKSAKIGDYIAFVSPASQYKSNYYFKEGVLVYSELLNDVEYRGDEEHGGKAQKVRTCLNIYKVYDREEEEDWREDKVRQIVRHHRIIKGEEVYEKDYDFYLANGTSGPKNLTLINKGEYAFCYVFKVLDEKYRNKIYEFAKDFKQYDEELKTTKSSAPMVDQLFVADKLKRYLFPTREERLDKDVKIHTILKLSNGWYEDRGGIREEDWKDYDYFITYWGEYAGDVSTTPVSGGSWGVKILNESRRTQIVEALYKVKNEYAKIKGEERTMNIIIFKSILIKLLYPSREERLEQDVLFVKDIPDYYINHMPEPGHISKIKRYDVNYSIRFSNDDIKHKFEQNIDKITKYIQLHPGTVTMSGGSRSTNKNIVKEALIKVLYPTREERLEQDVLIEERGHSSDDVLDGTHYDFYLRRVFSGLGQTAKVLDKPTCKQYIGINVINKSIYDRVKYAMSIYDKDVQPNERLTNYLKRHLYPQDDPQFEDYDYPEVRKPVHVERAVHGKPLIPVEYHEEIVKTPVEQPTLTSKALF